MPATRFDLYGRLDALGIAHRTYDHDPVFTVAESANIKLAMPGGHTKNLFLKDKKGRIFLLSALAETVIDLNALSKLLGAGRFSFGSADLLQDVLGVTPGSVTAFATINDALGRVEMLLDAALLEVDPVNFHPLANDATTAVSPQGLLRFLESTGHRPVLIRFDREGGPSLVEYSRRARHLSGDTKGFPMLNAAADLIKDGSDAGFMADVVEASKKQPVLVDFWAPWCGPCRQLTPSLERAVNAAAGKVKLVKINIDENPAIAGQLGVRSIPAVFAFDKGRPVDGFMGALPEGQLKMFIDRILGGGVGMDAADDGEADIGAVLDAAAKALTQGDIAGAAEAYAAVLQIEPENIKAIAGLARCYLAAGQPDRAKEALAMAPEASANDADLQGVRAALELADEAAGAGDPARLAMAVEANPLDHQSRYDLARGLAARGELQSAVDHLLAIVEKDREWQEGAARKHLLKIFDAAGAGSDIVRAGRRRLSAILFS